MDSTQPKTELFLRSSILPFPPYITSVEPGDKGYAASGFLCDILDTLSKTLHFGYSLTMPPDKCFGNLLANGNWTGHIGMLLRNESDMILGLICKSESRAKYVKFSETHYNTDIRLLASLTLEDPQGFHAFLLTFDKMIWIVVLLLYVLLILVSAFFDGATDGAHKECTEWTAYRYIWTYLALMVCEGTPCAPKTRRTQFIFGLWLLGVLVVNNSFAGHFNAVLLTRRENGLLRTLSDLVARTDLVVIIPTNSIVETVYKDFDHPLLKDIYQRAVKTPELSFIRPYELLERGVYQKVKHGGFVLTADELILKHGVSRYWKDLTGRMRLYLVEEVVLPMQAALAFRKNFPERLMIKINARILWMNESGLMKHWMSKYTRNFWKSKIKDDPSVEAPLMFKQLLPLFHIVAVQHSFCFVVFVAELCFVKYRCLSCQC